MHFARPVCLVYTWIDVHMLLGLSMTCLDALSCFACNISAIKKSFTKMEESMAAIIFNQSFTQ